MIGTIRKHSKWLWFVIITATIVSFLFFFSPTQRMGNGSGGGAEDFGNIYGKKVTRENYAEAKSEFYLFYWFHNGEWPGNLKFSDEDMQREIYVRLLLARKAASLGIHVGDEAEATAASAMLGSLGRNGQAVSIDAFAKQVLLPEGLTTADFENFVRNDLAIQQLIQSLGLTGALITPQEAATVYQREHQEISAQIVFFSASNYLSQIAVTPAAIGQFYTNEMAAYRLPDRVQVSYVEFNITNFLAQSQAEWAKTNFDDSIAATYQRLGPNYFPDAKTPDAENSKIREMLIHQRALMDARAQANDFATAVFNLQPARAENLAAVAKQKGLTVQTTAPFDNYGPQEFLAPEGFTKDAFALSSDEPVAGPVVGPTAVYVIALARQLPSEIPSLELIHSRVTQDYQFYQAAILAKQKGTNFVTSLAGANNFSVACMIAGLHAQTLPPFSLSSPDMPELGGRATTTQLKQSAFATPAGHAGNFEETEDGGFVIFVQSRKPVDMSKMNAELSQFTTVLRRTRENEAFNQWLSVEANRELRDTPLGRQTAAKQP
jgi:peptidyl-prolyl cis-trans isomerase D